MSDAGERRIELCLDIPRDARAVWECWERFEQFPSVLRSVVRVHPVGERRSLWEAYVGSFQQLWEAEVVECEAPRRLAWRSIRGVSHCGEVEITPTSAHSSSVSLRIRYVPRSLLERIGARLGIVDRTVAREFDRLGRWLAREAPLGTSREPAYGDRLASGDVSAAGHRRESSHRIERDGPVRGARRLAEALDA